MQRYSNNKPLLAYVEPSTKLFVLGIPALFLAGMLKVLVSGLSKVQDSYLINQSLLGNMTAQLDFISKMVFLIFILIIAAASVLHLVLPDSAKICLMVKRRLFDASYGNPLHLKEGERLPTVRCKRVGKEGFEVGITATSCTVEAIQAVSSDISSSLNRKYRQYAVVWTDTDAAFNKVIFRLEDVAVDRSLAIYSVGELKPKEPTSLIIQQGTSIDLTVSGSMIFSGKTRSGKTTGVIAILLQALLAGRDNYGSEIIIIDPKQAELSRLPHVVTVDESGEAREILNAMRRFADNVIQRQKILNDFSEEKGDAVHWWEAGFHPSICFIDEYVSVRTLFPKRVGKEDSEYSLASFDALMKRIVTQGASAGCYVIISIAEASVDEGGLPAMLRSACSTKVLFKPTLTEGRFLWDGDKLKDMPQRVYNAGDAWFSSTDGVHDCVSYVHFPRMGFPVYRELGRLLEAYYHV